MTAMSRAVESAVADEESNSLIVSAPDDVMPSIEKLVQELDVASNDVTELRVFHLFNADPLEMSELFTELFPDETTSRNNQNQGGFQFGGATLTTQFYFPGEPGNETDAIFRPELLLLVADEPEKTGRYNTVLDLA
jgi:hypothetical protein